MTLTEEQKSVIICAYLDLVGALKAWRDGDVMSHDWDAHHTTINELEESFDFIENAD
tara:strand:- start:587 stop:757 length:171 start_codon:yes stop_codon:yes gene_type:complete